MESSLLSSVRASTLNTFQPSLGEPRKPIGFLAQMSFAHFVAPYGNAGFSMKVKGSEEDSRGIGFHNSQSLPKVFK